MQRDIVLNGIHIGEHSFVPSEVKNEIYERVIKPGLNFVTIRTSKNVLVPQEMFIEWAEYLAENKIYFIFLYTMQHIPLDSGRVSQFDKETVEKMKEIAGEYFIGDMIGETGSSFACKLKGYYGKAKGNGDRDFLGERFVDMEAAHKRYVESVSKYINIDKELGIPDVISVEATGLNKYNAEAGVTIPMLELMCGHPDLLVSSLRGVARATEAKLWGTYVAHEWYGGMRHDDMLKRKRLALSYKYAYLSGTNAICLESGDEVIRSYGHSFEPQSPICEDYRNILSELMDFINKDFRPKGGPKVKVAFISGLHDAYGCWGGSALWNQFDSDEYAHSEAEHSWRIAKEIGSKRTWEDIGNYGDFDASALPAYGMYDIIPIEAPLEKLSRYDYLIFLGYNAMTDENMDKLTAYVENGGKLLSSFAHLNYSKRHKGEFIAPNQEKLERLFGVRFTGETVKTNAGVKLAFDSLDENLMYQGTKNFVCDPIYSEGMVEYAKVELTQGTETGFISESFSALPRVMPALVENRLGKGIATLVTSTNYPGHPSLYPFYKAIVREIISSSARNCDIKVIASDRLRYSVYEGNKMYLLNTDYDLPITVKIIYNGKEKIETLDSLELKAIELGE